MTDTTPFSSMPSAGAPPFPIPTADARPIGPTYRMVFHGRGSEYFGIWIVNLLLSILTLGIYSAWAKVRTQRYFYGATELDGSRFEYHGRPVPILIGRAIALAFFIPYIVLRQVGPVEGLAALALGLAVTPWLVVRAMRFRLRVSAYRNLRFAFDSTPPALALAYKYYLGLPILVAFTLGLLLPYVQHQQFRFLFERSRYGRTRMGFQPNIRRFYMSYLALVAFLVIAGIAMTAATAAIGIVFTVGSAAAKGSHGGDASVAILMAAAGILFYLALMATLLAFRGWIHKVAYEQVSIGDVRVIAGYRPRSLFALYLGNILLLLPTLGLAYPWVKCRTARYMLDRLSIVAPSGLDRFVADNAEDVDAVGDQMASLFDIDVGIGL